MSGGPALVLERVSRRFGEVVAVDAVSLAVGAGEFFSLLGPSGCGKTTTLRLIAGFEPPEKGGTIRMLGETVNERRPYQRPIGMVFQNYALFPHLDVARNVAFGLEERRVPRAEIATRVARALELVRLDPATYATRRPADLSGGQRQRVALARALVLEPPILLLDEPLGALDLRLRKEMQIELKELNRRLGITFILVTHDQEEALAMSDRIAVMHAGKVAQVGTPSEIYERPRTAFVAEFIGAANLLRGTVQGIDDGVATIAQGANKWRAAATGRAVGDHVEIALRPERATLHAPADAPRDANTLSGTIRDVVFLGETLQVVVALADAEQLRVTLRNDGTVQTAPSWRIGDHATVAWRPSDARVLDA